MSHTPLRAAYSVLMVVLALAAMPVGAESTGVKDVFSLLEKKYGLIDPATDARVARVQHIFARVQDAADKRGSQMPQLGVVNKADDPWAITLPDGHILLSAGAVALCYRNVSQGEGDARIAFVIGHELAHLANNDFWEMDIFLAIAGDGRGQAGRSKPVADPALEGELRKRREDTWRKESEADDLGFLYAGIAGYPVHTLFSSDARPGENFFISWTERARDGRALDLLHPPPKERESFLRSRLERLAEGVPLFRFGVRLALFGHCEQAIPLFRHFLHLFPAREVYNNLGVCHLERARQALRAAEGTLPAYWLPVLFDPSTRAEWLSIGEGVGRPQGGEPRIPSLLPDKTGEELELAVEYLEQSVAVDASYLPARLNLATAYYHRGQLVKARGILEEAVEIAPKNREVAGWHALLRTLDGQEQGFGEAAMAPMTRLASRGDAPHSLLFNYALLAKNAGKNPRAWWVRLASRTAQLPEEYARVVCRGARRACTSVQEVRETKIPWPLPMQPGLDLDSVDRGKLFSGWQVSPLGRVQDRWQGAVYRQEERREVLEMDGVVAMVVVRGGLPGGVRDLKKKAGLPTRIRPLAEGELWGYTPRWAVLVRDGQVREVWATATDLDPDQ